MVAGGVDLAAMVWTGFYPPFFKPFLPFWQQKMLVQRPIVVWEAYRAVREDKSSFSSECS